MVVEVAMAVGNSHVVTTTQIRCFFRLFLERTTWARERGAKLEDECQKWFSHA